jgi:LysM repeat protein
MRKFLQVVNEAEINQPAVKPVKVPPVPKLPAQDGEQSDGSKLTTNPDGTKTYAGGFGRFTFDKSGKAVTYAEPQFTGLGRSIDLTTGQTTQNYNTGPMNSTQTVDAKGNVVSSNTDYELGLGKMSMGQDAKGIKSKSWTAASSEEDPITNKDMYALGNKDKEATYDRAMAQVNGAPVQENSLRKFLSIVNNNNVSMLSEGANPYKVALPVQMAMQHYQQVTENPQPRESLIGKYVKVVEEELNESNERSKGHVRQLAERIATKINELSTDTLASYKKKAGADAKKADAEGDYARGDKRFKGINKATNKQFDNDLKKHSQKDIAESWRNIYNLNKQKIGNNPNSIKPGTVLKMPDGSRYKVKSGDNLSSIAKSAGTKTAAPTKYYRLPPNVDKPTAEKPPAVQNDKPYEFDPRNGKIGVNPSGIADVFKNVELPPPLTRDEIYQQMMEPDLAGPAAPGFRHTVQGPEGKEYNFDSEQEARDFVDRIKQLDIKDRESQGLGAAKSESTSANKQSFGKVPLDPVRMFGQRIAHGSALPAIKIAQTAGQTGLYSVKKYLDDLKAENPQAWEKAMQRGRPVTIDDLKRLSIPLPPDLGVDPRNQFNKPNSSRTFEEEGEEESERRRFPNYYHHKDKGTVFRVQSPDGKTTDVHPGDEKWDNTYQKKYKGMPTPNDGGFWSDDDTAAMVEKTKGVAEVAGPEKCWPGHRKVGTKSGTGKNAGKRVNDCEKINKEAVNPAQQAAIAIARKKAGKK